MFSKEDKVCICRSAFLGDWITTLPFVCYLLYDCHVKKENIFFLVLNNKGINPVSAILGSETVLSINTFVLNSSTLRLLYKTAATARERLPKDINKVVLLPFTHDDANSVFKKRLIAAFVFPRVVQLLGFKLTKPVILSESQYSSYFDRLNISYSIDRNIISTFLKDNGFLFPPKYNAKKQIAIYASSKLKMKIWPQRNFLSLITSLHDEFEVDFFLVGGKEDEQYNRDIINQLSGTVSIQNLAGKYDIRDTINFLSGMDLLIGNDGAPLHFGALVNTPLIGLYTYKEPIGSWDPILSDAFITYRVDVSCKHCFKEHCPNPVCLKYISEKSVIEAAVELLKNKKPIREPRLLIKKQPLSYKDIDA